MKGKEESPERLLNEIEASKLSDIKFKTMVIRKLNKLSENCKKLQGSCKELTVNYISMKKDIETISKSQELHQHGKGHGKYQQEPGGNEEYNF